MVEVAEKDVELEAARAALLPVKHGESDPKSKDGQAGAIAAAQLFLNRMSDTIHIAANDREQSRYENNYENNEGGIPVTGSYLDGTQAALKQYQSNFGLPETGKFDTKTIDKMVEQGFDLSELKTQATKFMAGNDFPANHHGKGYIHVGDTGTVVAAVQNDMREMFEANNLPTVKVTGIWTKADAEAAKKYQECVGAYPDGKIGNQSVSLEYGLDALKTSLDLYLWRTNNTQLRTDLGTYDDVNRKKDLEKEAKEINGSATNIAGVQNWLKGQDPTYAALLANGDKDGVDGLPGERTKKAITAYQTYTGIPITGKLDAATLEQMQSGDIGIKLKEAVAALPEDVRKKTDKLDADLAAPHHKGQGGGGNEHLPQRPRGLKHGGHE